ncbi:ParB/RepB/Spo0J family partition protein [Aquifex sp.]
MEKCKYTEPVKGYEIVFQEIEVDKVIIPPIERPLSNTLIERLINSIQTLGFIDPIMVVPNGEGYYEVIDGQHRLEAAKIVGLEKVPAFVLPKDLRNYILSFNIEKAPGLKEKAIQAYNFFMEKLEQNPDMREYELEPFIQYPFYITVGFVIEKLGDKKFPGSYFERILQKVDEFLDMPLKEAEKERENRARKLEEVKVVLNQKAEELGITMSYDKHRIVSYAFQKLYGRGVKFLGEDFYTVFDNLKEAIQSLTPEELGITAEGGTP